MAYRDDRLCHICGEEAPRGCPICGNGVCIAHTLAGFSVGLGGEDLKRAERLGRRLGDSGVCGVCLDREIERSQGEYVVIFRDHDPIQVQMLAEALEDAGFDSRMIGTQNAALLGAGTHAFEQRIEVPEPQAEAASALIQALLSEVS